MRLPRGCPVNSVPIRCEFRCKQSCSRRDGVRFSPGSGGRDLLVVAEADLRRKAEVLRAADTETPSPHPTPHLDIAEPIYGRIEARAYHGRRLILDDDRRAGKLRAGREVAAVNSRHAAGIAVGAVAGS